MKIKKCSVGCGFCRKTKLVMKVILPDGIKKQPTKVLYQKSLFLKKKKNNNHTVFPHKKLKLQ